MNVLIVISLVFFSDWLRVFFLIQASYIPVLILLINIFFPTASSLSSKL